MTSFSREIPFTRSLLPDISADFEKEEFKRKKLQDPLRYLNFSVIYEITFVQFSISQCVRCKTCDLWV